MRILVIDGVYEEFLEDLYARHPGYDQLCYQDAWRVLMDGALGSADFYSENLKKLGHEAEEVMINCDRLQLRWAAEHGLNAIAVHLVTKQRLNRSLKHAARVWLASTGRIGRTAYHLIAKPFRRLLRPVTETSWKLEILAAQIEHFRPDVLFNHALWDLDASFLQRVRPFVRLIVGQHASPLPPHVPYSSYDLMLSSLPNLVEHFRQQGVRSEYFKLGFGESVLERLGPVTQLYSGSFVGGFSAYHSSGTQLFEQIADEVPVDFWGYGGDTLPQNSSIRRRYHGKAWGIDMYRILAQSRIALNRHINVAEDYANNMRLYEATGVGTLLITDMKRNLNDLFEVGKEIVAYHDAQECIKLLKYYLEHEDERLAIAKAGQQRTLREHTYYQRMQELVGILERYLS